MLKPRNKQPKPEKIIPENRQAHAIWIVSSLTASIAVCGVLIYFGTRAFDETIGLINESGEKMVEKSGIEVTAELNEAVLENAEKILEKKNLRYGLPARVRNIFQFDAYINTGRKSTSGAYAATGTNQEATVGTNTLMTTE